MASDFLAYIYIFYIILWGRGFHDDGQNEGGLHRSDNNIGVYIYI